MKKNILGIAVGIAAGAVAGYYLNSDKGREQRKNAAAKAKELNENLKATTSEYVDLAKEKLDTAKDNFATVKESAKQSVADFASNVKSTINSKVSEASDEIVKGMKEAESSVRHAGNNAKMS
ncbi:MAG TPA: YtxH domain-containing protein [Saprospiraceae bacterium]|nr:YtxH domain-containing protein [Saprospiraceae bacterium]